MRQKLDFHFMGYGWGGLVGYLLGLYVADIFFFFCRVSGGKQLQYETLVLALKQRDDWTRNVENLKLT